jgi:hypothetical protein
MTPRKKILKTLSREHEKIGEPVFIRPGEINGFSENTAKFQRAVNELLKDRLIDGAKDEEGRMAVALNPHNLDGVRKELRPLWAKPGIWAMATVVVAVLVGLVGM